MRRLLILTIAALALAIPGVLLGKQGSGPVFEISGLGYGHGVGMSQCGAYGFAKHGMGYRAILAHYYTGTEIGTAKGAHIRVLLADGRDSVEIGSDAPFTVEDKTGSRALPAGRYRLTRGLRLQLEGKDVQLGGPVRFRPGKSPLELDQAYRGSLVVSGTDGGLRVVNDLGIEKYVRGVVAREMSPDWHPEALKVQAVAARSYALATRNSEEPFDVYSDTRSQAYGGIEAETQPTNAAVAATQNQIVTYDGKVAVTFFSASSGGKTAAIADVWSGSEPTPYLVSVDDPYDGVCSYHQWGPVSFSTSELESRLGGKIPDGLKSLTVRLNGSGRVSKVVAKGSERTVEIPGATMRTELGLRSTWFRITKR